MWLESKHHGRSSHVSRTGHQPVKNPCVPTMYAVKIADRHRSGAERIGHFVQVLDQLHVVEAELKEGEQRRTCVAAHLLTLPHYSVPEASVGEGADRRKAAGR